MMLSHNFTIWVTHVASLVKLRLVVYEEMDEQTDGPKNNVTLAHTYHVGKSSSKFC